MEIADPNKETAKAALTLMERVELKGAEVAAYIQINQLLGKISDGTLVVTEPPNEKAAEKKVK